ncbi:MAG: 4-hydroxy-tetrahydrodipicolinate reductase [Pseudomonadota bacterium]
MEDTIKIGVTGCTGRMGRMIIQQVMACKSCQFVGGTVNPKSGTIGRDIGEILGIGRLGLPAQATPDDMFQAADVVVDFTIPCATVNHARLAKKFKTPLVVGTTGLAKGQREDLMSTAREVPVLYSPNMSLGITLLISLVEQAAKALDPSFDIEVFDLHHRHKVDAPSGTAIALGQAAASGRKVSLEGNAMRCRTGRRQIGEIGFASLRGGEVIGDSKVIFAGDYEVLELSHRALSREIFASGALKAALWIVQQEPGGYTMKDVLGSEVRNN